MSAQRSFAVKSLLSCLIFNTLLVGAFFYMARLVLLGLHQYIDPFVSGTGTPLPEDVQLAFTNLNQWVTRMEQALPLVLFGAGLLVTCILWLFIQAALASGATLENDALRVELDPTTGAIRRLLDRAREVDLAGPQGLARYRYVPGRDPALAQDAGPVTITVEESGPLVSVLRAEGKAPGARSVVLRYRLVAGSDRLEVELLLDKLPVREKESAHLTFDLAVEEGRLRIDQGTNLMDPAKDALPGSCRDFVGVHSALDAAGPKGGVALGLLELTNIEGALRTGRTIMHDNSPDKGSPIKTSYRKRWLGRLPKRAITERKLEDQAYRFTGLGVPITGFDALQVFADMLELSAY